MPKKRAIIFFGAIIFLGLLFVFLVSIGYYPIALISGQVVLAREFSRNYDAAVLYYQNLLKTYEPDLPREEMLSPIELQASVLNQFVQNRLIDQAVRGEVGADLGELVEARLGKLQEEGNLAEAAKALYGLSYKDFEKAILVPQAKLDILNGRLFLKGQDFETWLTEAKRASNVIIFSRKFIWDGNEVRVNE